MTMACRTLPLDELAGAMKRLIRADRIRSVVDGSPSRNRTRLVVVSPDLPGV